MIRSRKGPNIRSLLCKAMKRLGHARFVGIFLAGAIFGGLPLAAASERPVENRLAGEASAYLAQHADNPVDWYPWGEEAFARARAENKLIFLSVGYATCYWCHVMEREVFFDETSAALLNAHFIAVMVDREERPDIDSLYMSVRRFTGGETGWPLSVILTPERKPLFAAGYLPNPEFRELLEAFRRGWATDEARYRAHARSILRLLARSHALPGRSADETLPDRALLARAAALYAKDYDRDYGGFEQAPKFPRPAVLEMLMALYERGGHDEALEMAVGTLEGMARGGIHDHLGGGFHRYAVDRAWRVPHFEKMLYDNAQLLHAFARAYSLTGEEGFRRVAEGIAGYVARRMTDPSGLFHSAEDSQTEGVEGAYYLWRADELRGLLSASDHALVAAAYGASGEPPLHGAYVLHRSGGEADRLAALGLSGAALDARLSALRDTLLAARGKRQTPFRDDKSVAAWNGLMIEALAYAGVALEREDFLRQAARAGWALQRTMIDGEGRLLRVANGGQARIAAYLEDYAAVILGFTALYRASGNASWRAEAARLAERMIARFDDPRGRGFADVASGAEELVVRPRNTEDGALPAGNSLALRALARLAALGEPRFVLQARKIASAFAPALDARPDSLPYMLWALEELHAVPPPGAAAPPRASAEVVGLATRLDASEKGAARGLALIAELRIAEGWHVNANPVTLDFLVPTRLDAAISGGDVLPGPVYPAAKMLQTPLGALGVFEHGARLVVPLPGGFVEEAAGKTVELRLEAQACNDTGTCLPPETIESKMYF